MPKLSRKHVAILTALQDEPKTETELQRGLSGVSRLDVYELRNHGFVELTFSRKTWGEWELTATGRKFLCLAELAATEMRLQRAAEQKLPEVGQLEAKVANLKRLLETFAT